MTKVIQTIKVLLEENADPEQKLWRAVLVQAFQDAFGPDRYEKTKTIKEEAQTFLTSYSDDNFIDVCENAGFDPSFVKRKVRKKFANNFVNSINKLSVRV